MRLCRRWILASDEAALVEAEWHASSMLGFVRRHTDPGSWSVRYAHRVLCVLITLLQYHQTSHSTAAFATFFQCATSKATTPDEYCSHTAYWIAAHHADIRSMHICDKAFDERAAHAHAALLELHI